MRALAHLCVVAAENALAEAAVRHQVLQLQSLDAIQAACVHLLRHGLGLHVRDVGVGHVAQAALLGPGDEVAQEEGVVLVFEVLVGEVVQPLRIGCNLQHLLDQLGVAPLQGRDRGGEQLQELA